MRVNQYSRYFPAYLALIEINDISHLRTQKVYCVKESEYFPHIHKLKEAIATFGNYINILS